jgi:hypothetical protein
MSVQYVRQRPADAQGRSQSRGDGSTGDILLFLDDDILLERDLLAAHLKNYEDPKVGAVGGFFLEAGRAADRSACRRTISEGTPAGSISRTAMSHAWRRACSRPATARFAARFSFAPAVSTRTTSERSSTTPICRAACARWTSGSCTIPTPRAYHLKEPAGGRRPGGVNEFVIADSATWQIWWYFFWTNFGVRGWRDIAVRFRGCVMRRVNVLRPWHLVLAVYHFVRGAMRARAAVRSGRILPLRLVSADVNADRTACAS